VRNARPDKDGDIRGTIRANNGQRFKAWKTDDENIFRNFATQFLDDSFFLEKGKVLDFLHAEGYRDIPRSEAQAGDIAYYDMDHDISNVLGRSFFGNIQLDNRSRPAGIGFTFLTNRPPPAARAPAPAARNPAPAASNPAPAARNPAAVPMNQRPMNQRPRHFSLPIWSHHNWNSRGHHIRHRSEAMRQNVNRWNQHLNAQGLYNNFPD
jgi:hypothetical protein